MKVRTLRGRAAFTLIELLVVIAIIAVLISLISAAVQRVRVLGPQTDNFHRAQKIDEGISSAKASKDQGGLNLTYIPSQPLSTYSGVSGFRLKSLYVGNEPELNFLKVAFPHMNTQADPPSSPPFDNGYTGPDVTLDANQTLTLFLTGGVATNFKGFSNNPRRPFLPPVAGEVRRGPYLEAEKVTRISPVNGQAWLVDPFGTPYAYFASVGGKTNLYGTQAFAIAANYDGANAPATGTVAPYKTAATRFVNENGFQIISAGRDRVFGAGDLQIPGVGNPGGADDQANFTKTTLSGGIN